jgi:hypothetical protein
MDPKAAVGWVAGLVAPRLNHQKRQRYAEAVREVVREEGPRNCVGTPDDFLMRWSATVWYCSLELPSDPQSLWDGPPLASRRRTWMGLAG